MLPLLETYSDSDRPLTQLPNPPGGTRSGSSSASNTRGHFRGGLGGRGGRGGRGEAEETKRNIGTANWVV